MESWPHMAKIIGSLGACHNFHGGYDMFPQVSWVKRTSQVGTVEPPDGIYACFAIISGEVLPEFKAEDHGIISIIWKKSNTPHEVQHCSLGILGARYLGSFSGCELLNFGSANWWDEGFPLRLPKSCAKMDHWSWGWTSCDNKVLQQSVMVGSFATWRLIGSKLHSCGHSLHITWDFRLQGRCPWWDSENVINISTLSLLSGIAPRLMTDMFGIASFLVWSALPRPLSSAKYFRTCMIMF